jgi:hypothetical protein
MGLELKFIQKQDRISAQTRNRFGDGTYSDMMHNL